jgi:hypothetical protein
MLNTNKCSGVLEQRDIYRSCLLVFSESAEVGATNEG